MILWGPYGVHIPADVDFDEVCEQVYAIHMDWAGKPVGGS